MDEHLSLARIRQHLCTCIICVLCIARLTSSAVGAGELPPVAADSIAAEVRIPRNGSLPVVAVEALGRTLSFVVDTGAARSYYDKKWQSHLGPVKKTIIVSDHDRNDIEIELFDALQ